MPKITKRLVEATEVREKDYIIFDGEIPGFGIRVLPERQALLPRPVSRRP